MAHRSWRSHPWLLGAAGVVVVLLLWTAITATGIATLARQNRITAISLDETSFDDTAAQQITAWTALRSLSIQNTRITDAGLLLLPNLDRLQLRGATVTESGIAELQRRHPKLLIDR